MESVNIACKGQYTIGIDIGGTKIKMCILDEKNHIVCRDSIETNSHLPWRDIVRNIMKSIEQLLEQNNMEKKQCVFMGMGIPGIVDNSNGTVVYANNLGWRDVHLVKEVKKYLNVPVILENDANCAAYGEYIKGTSALYGHMVLITLGTGVGAGVVMDGKIFNGGGPGGLELGHTTLVFNGKQCSCGAKGCAERYISATALIEQANAELISCPTSYMAVLKDKEKNMNGKIPFDAAKMGDPVAIALIKQYEEYLGAFIVNVVNVFRPDVVFISGGICNQGDELIKPINDYVTRNAYGAGIIRTPKIQIATLGNDAGSIGAGNLYRQF